MRHLEGRSGTVLGRTGAGAIALVIAFSFAGCGGGGKDYNIAPIFPLSSDKCAKYDGDSSGSGITAKCMVTKSECEKAAADWKEAMASSGVNDAIQFSCEG